MENDLEELFEEETKEEPEQVEAEVETKGEEASPPEEEKSEEPKSVPRAALEDERRKRQILQRENEELKGKLPVDEDEEPDPYEDPEAYKDFHIAKHEDKRLADERSAYVKSVEESREAMLAKQEDFVEVEQIFYILAQSNPELKEEMFDSADPAAYAYEKGIAWKAEQKENIISELKASGNYTEKAVEQAVEQVKPKIEAPSLAKATASGTNSINVEKEEGIEDMFENQVY